MRVLKSSLPNFTSSSDSNIVSYKYQLPLGSNRTILHHMVSSLPHAGIHSSPSSPPSSPPQTERETFNGLRSAEQDGDKLQSLVCWSEDRASVRGFMFRITYSNCTHVCFTYTHLSLHIFLSETCLIIWFFTSEQARQRAVKVLYMGYTRQRYVGVFQSLCFRLQTLTETENDPSRGNILSNDIKEVWSGLETQESNRTQSSRNVLFSKSRTSTFTLSGLSVYCNMQTIGHLNINLTH